MGVKQIIESIGVESEVNEKVDGVEEIEKGGQWKMGLSDKDWKKGRIFIDIYK